MTPRHSMALLSDPEAADLFSDLQVLHCKVGP